LLPVAARGLPNGLSFAAMFGEAVQAAKTGTQRNAARMRIDNATPPQCLNVDAMI